MIWHIFRKDLRLSWKIVLVAAVVQWIDAALFAAIAGGPPALMLAPFRQIIHMLAFFAVGIAAVAAVHNDPLPTATDDWRVRPIKRFDMMLAKVMFFLIAIEGPIFVSSLVVSVALGVGWPEAISGATVHGCATVLWLGLFSLGIGAVTSNVTEALLCGFVCLALFALMFMTGNAVHSAAYYGDVREVGMGGLTAGIAISGLLAFVSQFHWRKPRRWRAISLVVFTAGAAVSLLPVSTAMALADGVSGVSSAASRIRLTPDLAGGRQSFQQFQDLPSSGDISWLPFRVTGLASGELLTANPKQSDVVITGEAGTVRLRDPFFRQNHGFVWLSIRGDDRRNLQRAVNVSASYSFFVAREAGSYPVTVDGGSIRVPGLGACTLHSFTRAAHDGALLSCVSPLPDSACFELTAKPDEHTLFPCMQHSSDTLSWLWDWNALSHTVDIRDALPGKTLFLRVYQASHVTKSLELSNVQPGDWLAPPKQD